MNPSKTAEMVDAAKKVLIDNPENEDYFDKEGTYEKALTDAVTALDKAVWDGTGEGNAKIKSLKEAISAFNEDAKAYAQVIEDADMQAINRLIGIANKEGKYSGFTSKKDSKYYNYDVPYK